MYVYVTVLPRITFMWTGKLTDVNSFEPKTCMITCTLEFRRNIFCEYLFGAQIHLHLHN